MSIPVHRANDCLPWPIQPIRGNIDRVNGPKAKLSTSIAQHVYESLREDIITCKLRPHETISEAQLAALYGSSRTPVREACTRLEREGYLGSTPHKGFFVRELTLRNIQDLFQLRAILESATAETAAKAITTQELSELERVAGFSVIGGDEESFARAFKQNTTFHLIIAKTSRNQRIVDILSDVFDQMRRVEYMHLGTRPVGEIITYEQHQEIVDAIRSGDSALARELAFNHVRASLTTIVDTVFRRAALPSADNRTPSRFE